jgi:hypothetical protein
MRARKYARLVLVCIAGSVVFSGCDPAPENKDAKINQDKDVVWPLTYAIHTDSVIDPVDQVPAIFQAACEGATKMWHNDDSPQGISRWNRDKPAAVKFEMTGTMGRYGKQDAFAGDEYRWIRNYNDLVTLASASHSYWVRIADLVTLPGSYSSIKAYGRLPLGPPGKRGVAIDVNSLIGELLGHELGHNAVLSDNAATCSAGNNICYIMKKSPGTDNRLYAEGREAAKIIKVPEQ